MNHEENYKKNALGAGILRVCGIIELVFSGILVLTLILDIAFVKEPMPILRDLILIAAFIYSGLIAELNWQLPEKRKKCIIAGLILLAAECLNAVSLILTGAFGVFSIIIFILPALYLVGCMQLRELS